MSVVGGFVGGESGGGKGRFGERERSLEGLMIRERQKEKQMKDGDQSEFFFYWGKEKEKEKEKERMRKTVRGSVSRTGLARVPRKIVS